MVRSVGCVASKAAKRAFARFKACRVAAAFAVAVANASFFSAKSASSAIKAACALCSFSHLSVLLRRLQVILAGPSLDVISGRVD
ncbi:hypothetical protein [Lactobacillus delbrueckii]|uniref:hypothetical protein n=1 Tax=Lactobacillus delbrueckii TaxID=1584 RepID=UPI0021A80487|nr:hypothetical protein [Lactobacillus delbrueckii]